MKKIILTILVALIIYAGYTFGVPKFFPKTNEETKPTIESSETSQPKVPKIDIAPAVEQANQPGYDIFLIAGQSNTHYSLGFDPTIDTGDKRVKQLSRSEVEEEDMKIKDAVPPLDHHTKQPDRVGFGMTFAKLYADKILNSNRQVLLIPSGYAGSAFHTNEWNKGGKLYEDAVKRVNFALENNKNSKLIAILWHQGESDVGYPTYASALDTMINNMRTDITGDQSSTPFILGGMVPYWVNIEPGADAQQKIIADTVNRVANTGYVDPTKPTVITKSDDTVDNIHYDAAGQREMGKRYFSEYLKLINK